jgi:hypothetical protein
MRDRQEFLLAGIAIILVIGLLSWTLLLPTYHECRAGGHRWLYCVRVLLR